MSESRTKPQAKVTSSKEEINDAVEKFYRLFPSAAHCSEAICLSVIPEDFRCPCGADLSHREFGSRKVRCLRCKKEKFVTAGTFFNGVKKPVAYLAGIFLLSEGIAISGNEFAKRIGIASSTGLVILHEISDAILIRIIHPEKLRTDQLLDAVGKRSKETPAREHPHSEEFGQEKVNSESAEQEYEEEDFGGAPDEVAQSLRNLLLTGPMQFEEIFEKIEIPVPQLSGMLSLLEIFGLVKSLPGGVFKAVQFPLKIADATSSDKHREEHIKHFMNYIAKTHHKVSRKYLQRYAVRFWCFIDRVNCNFHTLLRTCALAESQSYGQLISYVSPPAIEMPIEDAA